MLGVIILRSPTEDATDAIASCADLEAPVIIWDAPLDRSRGFAGLRNDALDEARARGWTWALMLDADERLIVTRKPELDPRFDVIAVDSIDMYRSPKLIRLASGARFVGLVHEHLIPGPRREGHTTAIEFAEVPKTPERIARKVARDRELLTEQIMREPSSMRWPFYLGETYRLAREWGNARGAYRRAAGLRETASAWHREQAAWALFKSARCGWDSGEWDPIEDLAAGLVHAPWMVELPWFAAFVCYLRGARDEAIAWARMAESIRGTGPERLGFREDVAHERGPLELLQVFGVEPEAVRLRRALALEVKRSAARRDELARLRERHQAEIERFRQTLADRLEVEPHRLGAMLRKVRPCYHVDTSAIRYRLRTREAGSLAAAEFIHHAPHDIETLLEAIEP